MRDVLVGRIPVVLRADIYAVAALLGAAIVVLGIRRGLPKAPVMLLGGAACFGCRCRRRGSTGTCPKPTERPSLGQPRPLGWRDRAPGGL